MALARPLRFALFFAAGVTAFVAALFAALLWITSHLDSPAVKHRLLAYVREGAGIELDYRSARVSWQDGVVIEGLVVRSPAQVVALEPDLLRVGQAELAWSLFGPGPYIRQVRVTDVALSIVVDEHGRTSFDWLLPPSTTPEPPGLPLSQRPRDLLGAPPILGRIEVAPIVVRILRTENGQPRERLMLAGVGLGARFESASDGAELHLEVGSEERPLALELTRDGARAAAASVFVTAAVSSTAARAALGCALHEQALTDAVRIKDVLAARVTARFEPGEGRAEIVLEQVRAADGAVEAEASLVLPDGGDPFVRHAEGHLDARRALSLLAEDLAPLTIERGKLDFVVDGLTLGARPRFSPRGAATLSLEVERLERKKRLALAHADARLELSAGSSGGLTGKLAINASALLAGALRARGGRLALSLDDVQIDADAPLASRGGLGLEGEIASLEVMDGPSLEAALAGVQLGVRAKLVGQPPFSADADLKAAKLRLLRGGKNAMEVPASLKLVLSEAFFDPERPAESRAKAHVVVDAGTSHLELDALKNRDDVAFELSSETTGFSHLRGLLPGGIGWAELGLALRSHGRIDRLASAPSIDATTDVDLTRLAVETTRGPLTASSVHLGLATRGGAGRFSADLEVKSDGLTLAGAALQSDRATLALVLGQSPPALDLKLSAGGSAGALTTIDARLGVLRERRGVRYDVETRLQKLAPLIPLLAPLLGAHQLDLTTLEASLSAHGAAYDLLDASGQRLAPRFWDTIGGDGVIDLSLEGFSWHHGNKEVEVPKAAMHAELGSKGGAKNAKIHLEAAAAHLAFGRHTFDLTALEHDVESSLRGDLLHGEVDMSQRLRLGALGGNLTPGYTVSDVELALGAQRDQDGMVRVSGLQLKNGGAGTMLALEGAIEADEVRRRLSLRGELKQDLARLWNASEVFSGKGTVALDLRVESSDLQVFRTLASVHVADASVRLPRAQITVDAINGEIPLTVDLALSRKGIGLLRSSRGNRYSELRFADQHPLLSRPSFISIARIETPLVSIAPLAGNLEIEQNVVSLAQLELGVRGGRVSAQCTVDVNGKNSTMTTYLRATGVQSSHGEPFDGNAAMVISARQRSIDGRAEILRIGRRHLADLLDLQDPHHADASTNRIRSALALGYPEHMRVTFDHGFASVGVSFGGLARLIRVDELRGIPMGPLVDKVLAPLTKEGDEED